MPIGGFGLGFSGELANYMQQERQRARQQEDQQLDYHMELIKSLAQRPDINERPEIMGQAIHDMLELQAAKGGKGKQSKGMAGFTGHHDLPVSQFLTGLVSGARPTVGPTQELAPEEPSEPNLSAMQRMPQAPPTTPVGQPTAAAPTGGTSILNAPIAMPPPQVQGPPEAVRMIEAGRGIIADKALNPAPPVKMRQLPSEKQPYFVSPEERAEQKGAIARDQETLKRKEEIRSRTEEAAGISTMTPDQRTRYAVTGQMAAPPAPKGLQNKKLGVLVTPDGQRVFAMSTFNPTTGKYDLTDEYNNPIPPGSQPPQAGGANGASGYQQHLVQQPDGNYEIIYALKDPNAAGSTVAPTGQPQADGMVPPPPAGKPGIVNTPTGIKGKLPQPPQGNVVVMANPEGQQAPYRVKGNSATPITLPGGQAAVKGAAPEKMSAQGKQALVGINVVHDMIPGLLQDLQQIGLSNNPIGQSWGLFLAKRGISPGQAEESLLQTLGIADAYGLRGLMGGRPNQSLMEIVRVHLPQPGDATQLSWDKLHTLQTQLAAVKQAIIDAESTKLPQTNPYTGKQSGGAASAEDELMNFLRKK